MTLCTTDFQLFASIDDNGAATGGWTFNATGDEHTGPVFSVRITATGAREGRDETLFFSTLEAAMARAEKALDAADARKTCHAEEAAIAERSIRRDATSVSWLGVDGSALWTVTATVAVAYACSEEERSAVLGVFGKQPEPVHATDAARVRANGDGSFSRGFFSTAQTVTGPVWSVRVTADFSAETGIAGDVTELRASHWTTLEAAEECAIDAKRFQDGADVVVTRAQ